MKRKPLNINEIPEKFRELVQPNVDSIYLGNKHHKQLHSKVKCLCGVERLLRNERIRTNIKILGIPYRCQKCGNGRPKVKKFDPEKIAMIRKEYMSSNKSWNRLELEYGIPVHYIADKSLTKMRRLKIRRTQIDNLEKQLLENEKKYLNKQREELDKYEKSLEVFFNVD